MRPARAILLASHGTPGARAAERVALDLCAPGGRLHHLVVVPDFWKGMLGDDWLNNAAVHVRFGRYVENQLEREIVEHAAGGGDGGEAAWPRLFVRDPARQTGRVSLPAVAAA